MLSTNEPMALVDATRGNGLEITTYENLRELVEFQIQSLRASDTDPVSHCEWLNDIRDRLIPEVIKRVCKDFVIKPPPRKPSRPSRASVRKP